MSTPPRISDVLRTSELDLVIVVSPMSADLGRVLGPDAMVRWAAHRRLQREVARLEAAGTRVIAIEPGSRSLAAMGSWAMAEDRSHRVVRAAFAEAQELSVELRASSPQAR